MSNELTLDDVLGKDFKIEQFGYIFSNTLLNTVEQRFIRDDDSRIIDLKIVPQGNFAGYFTSNGGSKYLSKHYKFFLLQPRTKTYFKR